MRTVAATAMMLAVVGAVAHAGEATFSAHARDNNVEDLRRALAKSRPPTKAQAAVAYLVALGKAPNQRELVALDLRSGSVLWRASDDIRSRVFAGGGLVVHRQGADALVARSPSKGDPLFTVKLPANEKLVGVSADDEHLFYVMQANEGQRVSTVVAVDRGGREEWRKPAQGSLGAPAARNGVVAVPFRYQNVSLLDGKTGAELARVRNTDEQITFVRALEEGFYFGGGRGVYALDEKSASGTRGGSTFLEAKLGSDQVRPFYYFDGYQPAQTDYSAFDRNRVLWRASGGAFRDGLVVLHSYRYFFAFDAAKGRMRWAYAHPRVDIVSAEAVGPSIVFATGDGVVGAVDARTGAVTASHKTGLRLLGATFDAEGFAPAGVAGKEVDTAELSKALAQIVWDPDARFTAVKVFAVDTLGDLAGPEASGALLKIVLAQKGVPPAVQKKAGDELVARKDKEALPLYLEALKTRYDFLTDKNPAGIDVLARVVTALDAKQAAPDLAAHLLEPSTPQPALKELVAALTHLGGKDAVRGLRELLLTYRADPAFLADPTPLNLAAEGLLRIGGPNERRTVQFVAGDKRTIAPVAKFVGKLLSEPAAAPAPAAPAAPAKPAAAPASAPKT
jgi:outer membrane protein assembly factor BamB